MYILAMKKKIKIDFMSYRMGWYIPNETYDIVNKSHTGGFRLRTDEKGQVGQMYISFQNFV